MLSHRITPRLRSEKQPGPWPAHITVYAADIKRTVIQILRGSPWRKLSADIGLVHAGTIILDNNISLPYPISQFRYAITLMRIR
jgi:hypothetical protein